VRLKVKDFESFEQSKAYERNINRMANCKLWYKQPADDWVKALPIGNGRIGAVVFGGAGKELIQLNEDTLWSGYPTQWYNHEAASYLNQVRDKMLHGKTLEAQRLVEEKMLGQWSQSYLPLGDLHIHFENREKPKGYVRALDLETAVITDQYELQSGRFKREAFVSSVDDVLVYKITTENPINFTITLDSLIRHQTSTNGESLMLSGVAPSNVAPHYLNVEEPVIYSDEPEKMGMRFCALVKVKAMDGQVTFTQNCIEVKNTKAATLYVSMATSFNGRDLHPYTEGKDEIKTATDSLEKVISRDYENVKKDHIAQHQRMFGRMDFCLEDRDRSDIPTDERLASNRLTKDDLGLIPLAFQYGRYLLLSCSREGTQPANLQGIWNKEMRAYWSCNYTTNINVEMNYWPVEVSNLSDCHMPLIDLIEAVAKNGEKVARIHYDCKGWVAHHNLDIWATGLPAGDNGHGLPGWACCLFWPMGGPWLAKHLWEHYEFTMDENYLKNIGYPLMKKAAEFCLDWLVETEDGVLVTMPATSPENCYRHPDGENCGIDIATTSDMSCIYDLMTNCILASSVLGEDVEFRTQLKRTVKDLVPLRIGKFGELAEWSQDFEEIDLGHRHIAHLYSVYPGTRISEINNPEFLEAAKNSINRRVDNGGGGFGWGLTWLICFHARLKQSQKAMEGIQDWLDNSVYDNLFDFHPPLSETEKDVFQIDGNFGIVAGVAEMLIQSHNGYIEVLPALPENWKSGYIKGLKARGAFELDIAWQEGELMTVKVTAEKGGTCLVRYKGRTICLFTEIGVSYYLGSNLNLSDQQSEMNTMK
jgi:alpha-L-fucosidase 2